MADRVETNVRVPSCAVDALEAVVARRRAGAVRVSRDGVIRNLLDEHLALQDQRAPEDRLTHISTVLRYPPSPRWRTEARRGRLLRLRLSAGVADRARAVSLRLPGQARRAHRDYEARLLTDAVVTAIAVQEPVIDEFLDGLPLLVRHQAALGLWQLAASALMTIPEREVFDGAALARRMIESGETELSEDDTAAAKRLWKMATELRPVEPTAALRRVLAVAEALDEETPWHSPARHIVAANIARHRWVGVDDEKVDTAAEYEQYLYDRRREDNRDEWSWAREDLRLSTTKRDLLRGITTYDWSGRGGAAVWRAQRLVELRDLEAWLMDRFPGQDQSSSTRYMRPPGWLIRSPDSWCTHVLPDADADAEVPEPFATWIASKQLLSFATPEQTVLWPLIARAGTSGWHPVPGIEPVIAAAPRLRNRVSGFIEAILVDWQTAPDADLSNPWEPLHVPADKAYEFGLIDADERQRLMRQARTATLQHMTELIDTLPEDLQGHAAELRAAMGNAARFRRLTVGLGISWPGIVKATWEWPGSTVADELTVGVHAEALQWLARWVHLTCRRRLQLAMKQAFDDAFHRYRVPKEILDADRDEWNERPEFDSVTSMITPCESECLKVDLEPPF